MGGAVTGDGAALLAAVAAQPEDDTVRLAMADWLDEHGRHARAEFVRVQVEQANVPHCGETTPSGIAGGARAGCRWCRARKRSAELLAAHGDEWLRVPCPECGGTGRRADAGARMSWSRCPTCNCTGDAGGLYELVQWPNAPTVARRPVVWERGFPVAVEVSRLDDVLERVCTGCGGRATDFEGMVTCHCPHAGNPVVWRPTAWARAVVTHHPTVRELRVGDREPYPQIVYSHPYWFRNPSWRAPGPNHLPAAAFDALAGGSLHLDNAREYTARYYDSRAAALTALYTALARLVRAG